MEKFGIYNNVMETQKDFTDNDGQKISIGLSYDEVHGNLSVSLITSFETHGKYVTDSVMFTTEEQVTEAIGMLTKALRDMKKHKNGEL